MNPTGADSPTNTLASPPAASATPRPAGGSARLASIDGYRGLVMLLMMAEVLRFGQVSRRIPDSPVWQFLAYHQSHVEWVGCSLHDLIQPSFSFLVGVALPFSLASRLARGQSRMQISLHAGWRALILILLGVFLRSLGAPQTNWTFEDTLTQIGLGYGFLFLLGTRPVRDQWSALGLLLVGYFAAFALYPLPGPDFDYARVGVSAAWLKQHGLEGFAAHWQKNSNLAWAFDVWFLNLFPRKKPFVFNEGGYATLNFIPTLATMILGLIAGGVLRSARPPAAKIRWLALVGLAGLVAGWAVGALGICPVVKRIWTPSWVLYSGGWCCLLLAAFVWLLDQRQWTRWAFVLIVVGMNSIAAYCIAHVCESFIASSLKTHLGANFFAFAGSATEPFFRGLAILLIYWLILFWMYRRKLFLRI